MIFPPLAYARNFFIRPPIISKWGGFVIQRHNELRDMDDELISTVCSNAEGEPVLQDTGREKLSRGANKAQRWSFLHVDSTNANDRYSFMSESAPNIISCKNQAPQSPVLKKVHDIKHRTFTSLLGNMEDERLRFQELIDLKKRTYLRLFYSAVTMGSHPLPKQSNNTN